MTLSSRFNVIGNKIHFSYMDFAGYIEANTNWVNENEFKLGYVVSITKNGVDFKDAWYPTLEDALRFLGEYNETVALERETKCEADIAQQCMNIDQL